MHLLAASKNVERKFRSIGPSEKSESFKDINVDDVAGKHGVAEPAPHLNHLGDFIKIITLCWPVQLHQDQCMAQHHVAVSFLKQNNGE